MAIMKQPPLFQRIIFVDWHGVISKDPFWTSILQDDSHPLRPQLEQKLGELFARKAFTLKTAVDLRASEIRSGRFNLLMSSLPVRLAP